MFCLAFGPAFVRALQRFRARLEVRWISVLPTAEPPRSMKKSLLLALAAATLLGVAPAAPAADRPAARAGAAWLSSAVRPGADGMAADALVALRAAGRLPSSEAARRAKALRAGANAYARTAGAAGKTILALVAARSGSARCAPGVDLLARLRSIATGAGGTGATIYDQAYGMLAAHALRAGPSARAVPRAAAAHAARADGTSR